MRYKVTKEIIDEIKAVVSECRGKAAECSRSAGIPHAQLSAIIAGRRPVVQEDTWMRLCSVFPRISSIANPISPMGTGANPISQVMHHVGDGNRQIIENKESVSSIDAYRVRVQDRLLEEADPVPVKRVLRIMKEEAP